MCAKMKSGPNQKEAARSVKRSERERVLRRQAIIQIGIGTFMIFAYPRLPGFIIGGLLVTLGLVMGVLYFRERSNN